MALCVDRVYQLTVKQETWSDGYPMSLEPRLDLEYMALCVGRVCQLTAKKETWPDGYPMLLEPRLDLTPCKLAFLSE